MNWTSSWSFVQRKPWLTLTVGMVCEWLDCWSLSYSTKADDSWDSDVSQLAEEFYPVVPSPPSTREERHARLANRRVNPSPQLPAQELVEPPFTEGAATAALRPGESYKIYYARDILGSVSEEYALVVERAARWCGIEDETIYAVVERFERRFLRWKKKKDELGKDLVESESEAEDGEEVEE